MSTDYLKRLFTDYIKNLSTDYADLHRLFIWWLSSIGSTLFDKIKSVRCILKSILIFYTDYKKVKSMHLFMSIKKRKRYTFMPDWYSGILVELESTKKVQRHI